MYDKIKTDTQEAFRGLYPHGTLEDVTGQVIRYLAASVSVRRIGGIPIDDALLIADDISYELGAIAFNEMRTEANEE